MELTITEKNEEPLLSRTKIKAEINFDNATISKKDLKGKIASSLNVNENLVVVKDIHTRFGEKKADALAYCYRSEEELKKIEPREKKKKEGAEKAEAQKPKEEPKETKKE